ncbi:MAG: nitroreductase [Pseudomonadota bacterium]
MEVIEAIRSRRSIRSFKSDPVPGDLLKDLLQVCQWAPNASNTQPWEFAVLGGKVLEEVKNRLVEKVKAEWDSSLGGFRTINPDIPFPDLPEPYVNRAAALKAQIDGHQFPPGIEELENKRHSYLLYGSRFYGAPNAIILYTEKAICPKAILDIGIMAQTIAIAALDHGLGTCLTSMVVFWPEIYRDLLGIPESKLIALAIAIGYPDNEALVNTFKRTREPLNAYTHWHGV